MTPSPFFSNGASLERRQRFRYRCILRPLPAPAPWTAFVAVQAYPVPQDARDIYRQMRRFLLGAFPETATLPREAFFQADRIDFQREAPQLQQYGQWLGSSGLGIYPHRDPPALWTTEQMRDLFPPEEPPSLFFDIVRIDPSPEAVKTVGGLLLGSGSVTEVYCTEKNSFYKAATAAFLPRIQDRNMRAYRYHAPLLQGSAIGNVDAATLDGWSCGAQLYVRESVEDNGLLFLRRGSLERILPQVEQLAAEHDFELVTG